MSTEEVGSVYAVLESVASGNLGINLGINLRRTQSYSPHLTPVNMGQKHSQTPGP